MNEKLLLKCRNVIVANEITNLLTDHNVAYRQHDESQDQRNGAYGPITGVAIYVFEEDYDRANDIVQPIINEIETSVTPSINCDSKNARHKVRNGRYTNVMSIVAIIFILASGGYFVYVHKFGFETTTLVNWIALTILFTGIAIPLILKFTTRNRKRKSSNVD